MTANIFYFVGYLILLLVLWAITPIRRLLIRHKPELLSLSSGYLFVLADIKSDDETKVIFDLTWKELNSYLIVVGIVVGIIGIVISAKQKLGEKTKEDLQANLTETKEKMEKIKLEYYGLCSDNIKEIFSQFFKESGGNGRVSLYKHEGHYFTLLGRAADNPVHSKRGQETYPDNEGFIALGWQQGTFQIHSIPAWAGRSGTDYRKFMKAKCQISDGRLKKLTMRSRSFYIYRFNNDNAQNPHGIIVFERISETPIEITNIHSAFEHHESQLISLLKSMRSLS